jgi:ribonucleoside-diphosphate reductase alpha chain
VIDMNAYPVEEIDQMTKTTRKIGLGVMGWADLLYRLGVPYDTDEAIELADRTMGFIREHADRASAELAAERGVFPAWEGSIYGTAGKREPMRNSTRTTVAPTGTLSIIASCSGGIEPAFSLAFTRQHYLDPKNPSKPVRLNEVNPVFAAVAHERGFYSEELVDHLARGGSLHDRDEVPEDVKRVFVTSHDIAPTWHVQMQAAFQRHTDNAVSKTINFPNAATEAEVAEAYMLAYREGCKGITIYRDGSRTGQVLSYVADGEALEAVEDDAPVPGAVFPVPDGLLDGVDPLHRRRLPDERQSLTHKFRVGEQEGYVTVGLFEDGTPGEIFVTISKEGSTIRGLMDSVAMLTSYSLQYGVALRTLVDKFRGVHFEPAGFTSNPAIPQATSLVDYIFRWLELKFLSEEQGTGNREQGAESDPKGETGPARPEAIEGRTVSGTRAATPQAMRPRSRGRRGHTRGYVPPSPALPFPEVATGLICSDCGSQLVSSEGCLVCRSCGFTRCG